MIAIRRIGTEAVKDILKDPELWSRVSDGVEFDRWEPPAGHEYLGCFDDDELCGFFWLHGDTSTSAWLHINILKQHRSKAVDFVCAFYQAAIQSEILKFNAKIPACYPDVYRFAKKCGFVDEGVDRQSIIKDGELVDRHILGMTKTEMQKWVQ